MFDPDGRNGFQSIGHGMVHIVKFICMVLAVVAVAPVVLFLLSYRTMQLQELATLTVNQPQTYDAFLIDFNEPVLNAVAPIAHQAWREAGSPKGIVDPALQTLPFTCRKLKDTGDGDYHAYSVQEQETRYSRAGSPVWVYYNMPFAQSMVYDKGFKAGYAAGVQPRSNMNISSESIPFERYDMMGKDDCSNDPWYLQGMMQMVPTNEWDWQPSAEYILGKAAGNQLAYVSAARAISRVRYIATMRKLGLTPSVDPIMLTTGRAKHMSPAHGPHWAEKEIQGGWDNTTTFASSELQDRFLKAYSRLFKGSLPAIVVHRQAFIEDEWQKDPYMGRVPRSAWSFVHWNFMVDDGFLTGMHAWEGPGNYSANRGRPVFTRTDFLFRSTPYVQDEVQDVRDQLLATTTLAYWLPRLQVEGLDDPKTIQVVDAALGEVRQSLNKDKAFARRFNNLAFKH